EAGPKDRHELLKVPAGFNYVAFDPRFIWNFKTDIEPGLGGRVIDYMRGRTLGGSSSVNAMVHVRGHREDFEGWKRSGCHGWGWEDVLPYFIKSESHEMNRTGNRGGCLVKVKQVPQRVLQVVDSTFLRLLPAGCLRSIPADVDG